MKATEAGGEFDPGVIRRFYYLLGHCGIGLTEVRAIGEKGVVGIGFFNSLSCLVRELARLDGDANLYVGRNPRPLRFAKQFPMSVNRVSDEQHTGGSSKDIEYLTCLYLDIDPVRAPGEASTNAEHEAATTMARSLADEIPGGVAFSTGNGAAVFIPVRQYRLPAEFSVIEMKCKVWEASLRTRVEAGGVLKLDFMQDMARIIRITGTMNIKGTVSPDRPQRRATFLSPGLETGVLGRILSRHYPASTSEAKQGQARPDVLERIECLLERWPKFRDTWTGSRNDLADTSRSGYDMAVSALLAAAGWSVQDITLALEHCPAGRGRESKPEYRMRTAHKALHGR